MFEVLGHMKTLSPFALRRAFGLVLCLSLAGPRARGARAAGGEVVELLTEDGVWTEAARADLELVVERGNRRLRLGRTTVPIERLVALRFQRAAVAETVESGMVLRNGDLLVGTVEGLTTGGSTKGPGGGRIEFLSESLGPIHASFETVLALSFGPRRIVELVKPGETGAPEGRSAAGAGPHRPKERPAGAELANGDFVRGEVVFVNKETVGVNNGRRVVQIPRERTSLVKLGGGAGGTAEAKRKAAARPRLQKSAQFVRLVSGDRLSGSLKRLDNSNSGNNSNDSNSPAAPSLVLETALAGTVVVPLAAVAEVWSEGGPLLPVSTLDPIEVKQTPQFDESFPYRLDQGLSGSFLSVGGRRFERGLGCHSRCELEYALPRGVSAFLAEIGIDDSVGGCGGEVVFRVLVDGREVFESGPVGGGAGPRTVRVPLRGARRMRLAVDFGPDGSSVADHADWGRALLVRR